MMSQKAPKWSQISCKLKKKLKKQLVKPQIFTFLINFITVFVHLLGSADPRFFLRIRIPDPDPKISGSAFGSGSRSAKKPRIRWIRGLRIRIRPSLFGRREENWLPFVFWWIKLLRLASGRTRISDIAWKTKSKFRNGKSDIWSIILFTNNIKDPQKSYSTAVRSVN